MSIGLVEERKKFGEIFLNCPKHDVATNFIKGVPEIHFEERFRGLMMCAKIDARGVRPGFSAALYPHPQLMGGKLIRERGGYPRADDFRRQSSPGVADSDGADAPILLFQRG